MDSQPKKPFNKASKIKNFRSQEAAAVKKAGQIMNSSPVCFLDADEVRPEYKSDN